MWFLALTALFPLVLVSPTIAQAESAQIPKAVLVNIAGAALAADSSEKKKGGGSETPDVEDPAMAAFMVGDFAKAEVEFEQAIQTLRRNRENLRSSAAVARNGSLQGEVARGQNSAIGVIPDGSGSGSVVVATPSLNVPSSDQGVYESFGGSEEENVTGNYDEGFLHYMLGLSQIQLGKLRDARNAFNQALTLNSAIPDAHFRLGLLDLNDGDVDSARGRLDKLSTAKKRCRKRCDGKAELEASIATLTALIKQHQDKAGE